MDKKPSFVIALRNYFGILPGRTPTDFMREYKQLTTSS